MSTTIVIVDDDSSFVEQLDDAFTAAGHRVFGETDGEHAIQTINELRDAIGVAIVDFVTRGITGFELIGMLRRRPTKIKIIATLPPIGPDLSELALQAGADMVIRRPKAGVRLEPQEWLNAVAAMLTDRAAG